MYVMGNVLNIAHNKIFIAKILTAFKVDFLL